MVVRRKCAALLCSLLMIWFALVTEHLTASAPPVDIKEQLLNYWSNPEQWPALHYAIEQKRPDVAEIILDLDPDQAHLFTPSIMLMDSYDGNNADQDYDYQVGIEEGQSALELAVRYGYSSLVSKILRLGADVNRVRREYLGRWGEGWKPRGGRFRYEKVKYVTRMWYDEHSILHWALKGSDPAIVSLLLEQGVHLDNCLKTYRWGYEGFTKVETFSHYTSFDIASQGESTLFLKRLMYHSAARAGFLHILCEEEINDETVELLRTYLQNRNQWPPLHNCVAQDDLEAFELFLDYGLQPEYQGNAPTDLITMVACHHNPAFFNKLLACHTCHNKLFNSAIKAENLNLVASLLKFLAPTNEDLETALLTDNPDLVRLILDSHDKIEPYPEALEQAIKRHNSAIVHLLLDYGYNHPRALSLVIEGHDDAIFFLMIERGFFDESAFMAAVESNELSMLKALIQRYPISTKDRLECMRRALALQHKDIVDYLFTLSV